MVRSPTGIYDFNAGEFPQPADTPFHGDFHGASTKARQTRKRHGRCAEKSSQLAPDSDDQHEDA